MDASKKSSQDILNVLVEIRDLLKISNQLQRSNSGPQTEVKGNVTLLKTVSGPSKKRVSSFWPVFWIITRKKRLVSDNLELVVSQLNPRSRFITMIHGTTNHDINVWKWVWSIFWIMARKKRWVSDNLEFVVSQLNGTTRTITMLQGLWYLRLKKGVAYIFWFTTRK